MELLFFLAMVIFWLILAFQALVRVVNVQTLAEARVNQQEQDRRTCFALQQAAIKDIDPVLTGLLLVEMDDSLQLFQRTAEGEGGFRPSNKGEEGGVSVVEMVLKAGIFSYPEDEKPDMTLSAGMTIVMKAVTTYCDIELLSRLLKEEDEDTSVQQAKAGKTNQGVQPEILRSDSSGNLVRRPSLKELKDVSRDSEKKVEKEWPIDILLWHHLRLISGKFIDGANPDACKEKARRVLEMAEAMVMRLEVEETIRQGSDDPDLLWEVVARRDKTCLEYMLRANASIMIYDDVGRTPLHEASTNHWKEGIELFRTHGFDFDKALMKEDFNKMTPTACLEHAHYFAEKDHLLSDGLLSPDDASFAEMQTLLTSRDGEEGRKDIRVRKNQFNQFSNLFGRSKGKTQLPINTVV